MKDNEEKKSIVFSEFKMVLSLIVLNFEKFKIDYKIFTKNIVDQNILTDEPFIKSNVVKKIDTIATSFLQTVSDPLYGEIFKNDINELITIINKYSNDFSLANLFEIGKKTLPIMNKEFQTKLDKLPQLFVVDEFPHPYENITAWDFMYADIEDREKYKIEEGLYFHKDRQFPFFCEYVIIHELIHFFIDQIKINKKIKSRWLEEAIANWFAFIVHYRIFKNLDFLTYVKNVNKLYAEIFPYSVIAEYLFYDKAFQKIYQLGGHRAIIKMCREYLEADDNKKWDDLFEIIQKNKYEDLKVYSFNFRPLNELDMILADVSPDNHIFNFTSLEYLIITHLAKNKNGILIADLASSMNADLKLIEKGTSQLQNRGYVVLENKKVVIIENVFFLLNSNRVKVNHEWKSRNSN